MYRVVIEDKAKKELRKLDRFQAKIIINWIRNNLEGSSDPRVSGKQLTANLKNHWRYRVGEYRLLAEIKDDEVIIHIVKVGHRKGVYK